MTGDDFHVALDLEPAHRKAGAGFSAGLQQLKDSCHLGQAKREAAKSCALTLVLLPEFMPARSGYSSLPPCIITAHKQRGAGPTSDSKIEMRASFRGFDPFPFPPSLIKAPTYGCMPRAFFHVFISGKRHQDVTDRFHNLGLGPLLATCPLSPSTPLRLLSFPLGRK